MKWNFTSQTAWAPDQLTPNVAILTLRTEFLTPTRTSTSTADAESLMEMTPSHSCTHTYSTHCTFTWRSSLAKSADAPCPARKRNDRRQTRPTPGYCPPTLNHRRVTRPKPAHCPLLKGHRLTRPKPPDAGWIILREHPCGNEPFAEMHSIESSLLSGCF